MTDLFRIHCVLARRSHIEGAEAFLGPKNPKHETSVFPVMFCPKSKQEMDGWDTMASWKEKNKRSKNPVSFHGQNANTKDTLHARLKVRQQRGWFCTVGNVNWGKKIIPKPQYGWDVKFGAIFSAQSESGSGWRWKKQQVKDVFQWTNLTFNPKKVRWQWKKSNHEWRCISY